MNEPLPAGAKVRKWGSPAPAPAPAPTIAEHVARSVYPNIEITDVLRDPASSLARKNPRSWHVRAEPGTIPIDARPLPGMSFDDFVGGFRAKGLEVLEARDEVNNPSSHATGPHWHVVLRDSEGLPANARIKRLGTPAPASATPAAPASTITPSGQEMADVAGFFGTGSARPMELGVLDTLKRAPKLDPAARAAIADLGPVGVGFTEADQRRGMAVTPEYRPTSAPRNFQTTVDPAKLDKVQAAFDAGASREQLFGLMDLLGLEKPSATAVREAINFRNSGGKGARFVAANATPYQAPENPTPEDPYGAARKLIEDKFGKQELVQTRFNPNADTQEQIRRIGRSIGHSNPERLAEDAEWAPLVGGMIALDDARKQFGEGNYITGTTSAALGAVDLMSLGGAAGKGAKALLGQRQAILSALDVATDPAKVAQLRSQLSRLDDEIATAGQAAPAVDEDSALGQRSSAVGAPTPPATQPETGSFGPIFRDVASDYPAAVARLREAQGGQVPGALHHPDIGDIDLVWGTPEAYGLSKIEARHPEVLADLPNIIARLPVKQWPTNPGNNRFVLEDDAYRAIVSPDYNGEPQQWLVTAFERKKDAPGGQTSRRDPQLPNGGSSGIGATSNIGGSARGGNTAPPAFGLPEGARILRMGDEAQPSPAAGRGPLRTFDNAARLREIAEEQSARSVGRILGSEGTIPGTNLPARPVRPDEVLPFPGNRVESADELPVSIGPIDPPTAPGRAPKRPVGFTEYLRGRLKAESAERGVPVRIDAEDAIDKGVPAELIYSNPTEVNKAKLRLRNPSLFGTRYGRMSGTQQVLRSLDMDDLDPLEWGFDAKVGGRLEPEDVGDLMRRDLEGDTSALQRGSGYDEWTAYHDRVEAREEFAGRYPDGPPVERKGEPVGPDDLDNLEPPLSAYEDAPRLVKRVGNLNLERVEKPEDVTRLVQRIAEHVRVDNKSLMRVTNEETRRLAAETGVSPQKILEWKEGQGLSAADLYGMRVVVQQGRTKLMSLARKARGASDADLARFHNMVMAQAQIERQLAGMTASAGRALQQFNMIARGGDLSDDAMKAYLRSAGADRESVERIADKIIDLAEDPTKAGRFIQALPRLRKRDLFNEYYINSLLSGPGTQVVNASSNSLMLLWTLPETALTAAVGVALRSSDRAHLKEVVKRAQGMVNGVRPGLKNALEALKTGMPTDGVSRVEARNHQAIPNFALKKPIPLPGGRSINSVKVGSVVRIPTRVLQAADELFKEMNRSAAIDGLAFRRAMNGPGTPEERLQKYRDLIAEPDEALRKAAQNEALYNTIQNPLGPAGRALQTWLNETPGAKIVVPFPRSSINLIKWFAARNPMTAPMLSEVREAFKLGGVARDEAISRIMLGSAVGLAATMAAMNGQISGGGPSDPAEMAALKNSGWQPYSIRTADGWVSYQRLDPLTTNVGIAADLAESGTWADADELDEIAMAMGMSAIKNMRDKTWLQGADQFFDAIDPSSPHKLDDYLAKTAATVAVPQGLAQLAGSMDPELRDARSLLDRIRARVPTLSRAVDQRLNVWGEPIKRQERLGPKLLSPVFTSTDNKSPLMQEVARLKLPLDMPARKLRVNGEMVELTQEQYSYYVQLSGKPAKTYLEQYMEKPRWKRMDDEKRAEFIKEKLLDYRATARGELRKMFPELANERRGTRIKSRVKDGDTFSVDIRLQGADAFEVKQKCQKPDGTCSACGQGARRYMRQIFEGVEDRGGRKGLRVSFTGESTYGRPVANATINGEDVGEMMIRDGWAVAMPEYLKSDPDRLRRYQAAEAEARQQRRGAHAFRFNTPEEYRKGRRLQCEYAGRGR